MYDITIHVEDEKDLYNSFDSSRETLSDDFVSYIEEQLEGRKIIENVQLILRSDNPIDSNQLEKALDSFLEARRKALDRDKRIKKWESIKLGKEKYGLPEKEEHAWTNFIR